MSYIVKIRSRETNIVHEKEFIAESLEDLATKANEYFKFPFDLVAVYEIARVTSPVGIEYQEPVVEESAPIETVPTEETPDLPPGISDALEPAKEE